jgi:asparagine synthase (glutamine-hydrolysing)
LRYGYIPAPRSIYAGISKLVPGTLLRLHGSETEHDTFWSPSEVFERGAAHPFAGDETEAADELDRLLRRVIRGQMIADVPLGAFFSGGIDSSTVVAIMQAESPRPVRTFTVGFDDPACDETGPARLVSEHLRTDHYEIRLAGDDALGVVPLIPDAYDEPFADASQIPMMVIARHCRPQVKVCLSGDGGDELFGGYPHYRTGLGMLRFAAVAPRWMRVGSAGVLASAAGPAEWLARKPRRRLQEGNTPPLSRRLTSLSHRLRAGTLEGFYHRSSSRWHGARSLVLEGDTSAEPIEASRWAALPDPVSMMMYQDFIGYLPDDILVKVDRATMAVGLEARAPYLDHRIVEWVARLPLAMRLRAGVGKWLLRRVLGRYVPPALTERRKQGFGPPLRRWLRGPLREWGEDLLQERSLSDQGFLQPGLVRQIWTEFQAGSLHWTGLVWSVLMFQAWLARARPGRSPS